MQWAFLDHPVPFGIAHQGGTDVAPGNTEASFQHVVSLGYRYIETDVQATSDGVLVVFHNKNLGPTTGTKDRISNQSWAQLSDLRIEGEHPIPGFEDMIERFPAVRFNVEPKTDEAVGPLIELIRRRGIEDRICVGSFSDRRLARMRHGLGPTAVCSSPGPKGVMRVLSSALVGASKTSLPYGALQIPPSYFGLSLSRKRLINNIHLLGLQVHCWTINDEATMNRLFDNGVDAIMSDRITLLRDVLEARGQWLQEGEGTDRTESGT